MPGNSWAAGAPGAIGFREPTHLLRGNPIGDSRAAAERLIAEGRLPVPSNYQLRTIQKLRSIQIRPGKIGAIEYRFEEIRTLQMGA